MSDGDLQVHCDVAFPLCPGYRQEAKKCHKIENFKYILQSAAITLLVNFERIPFLINVPLLPMNATTKATAGSGTLEMKTKPKLLKL